MEHQVYYLGIYKQESAGLMSRCHIFCPSFIKPPTHWPVLSLSHLLAELSPTVGGGKWLQFLLPATSNSPEALLPPHLLLIWQQLYLYLPPTHLSSTHSNDNSNTLPHYLSWVVAAAPLSTPQPPKKADLLHCLHSHRQHSPL